MGERERFWRSNRWRQALRPDVDLAQAEGLAAGTGLLTGTVAKTAPSAGVPRSATRCEVCGGRSEIVVVDLVAHDSTLRCIECNHRWTTQT